jgi:hypothetical protein
MGIKMENKNTNTESLYVRMTKNKTTNAESCHVRMTKGIRYQLKLISAKENMNMQEALLMMIKQYELNNKSKNML